MYDCATEEEALALIALAQNPPQLTQEELDADNLHLLRQERNRLLAETDWWASADLTMTAEQTAYRQALRDITNTYTSLDDVIWPTKP